MIDVALHDTYVTVPFILIALVSAIYFFCCGIINLAFSKKFSHIYSILHIATAMCMFLMLFNPFYMVSNPRRYYSFSTVDLGIDLYQFLMLLIFSCIIPQIGLGLNLFALYKDKMKDRDVNVEVLDA